MRHGLALAALLLPLSACVVAPPPPVYGYGYPPPPPGYPVPDPGYAFNDGAPTMIVAGVSVPLIFYGGSWGYWDSGRGWHPAPEGIDRSLRQRFPGGVGYRPGGGAGPYGGQPGGPRPGGYPAGGNPYAGRPGGPYGGAGAPGYRPQGQPVQRAAVPARPQPERHRDNEPH